MNLLLSFSSEWVVMGPFVERLGEAPRAVRRTVGTRKSVFSNKVGSRAELDELDLSLVVETASQATRRRASSSLSHGSRRFKLGTVRDAN